MNKTKTTLLLFGITLLFLSGCGQQKAPTNIDAATILVGKEGNISYYLTDEFDKEYYSLDELRSMAESEVSDYNSSNGFDKLITVDKVEQSEEKKVVVAYSFPDKEIFSDFTGTFFEYDTVENARLTGYMKEGMNLVGKDGIFTTSQEAFLYLAKNHVVIADAGTVIYTPYKVQYYSEGATLRADGGIDSTAINDENKKVIIILKK